MPFIRRALPTTPQKVIKSVNSEADAMPSIRLQTPWNCQVFSFGKAQVQGVDYFNSGLIQRNDGLWLITRRCVWDSQIKIGLNDLMAFIIDPVTLMPQRGIKLNLIKSFTGEHFEDPRAVVHNGRTFVSCCNFVILRGKGWTGAHQAVFEVNDQWQMVNRWDPVYGNNGSMLGKNSGHEKNWLFFFRDGRPHMVYGATPHTLVELDDKFQKPVEHVTTNPNIEWIWTFGEIRGGTPPVLIDDEYWTFFHSSMPWREDGKRWYVMGAYAFQSTPPFQITRITTRPLLCGSKNDRWAEGKPLVVFPCGALMREGKWLVTGGLNDLDTFFIEIPHTELLERMIIL